MTTTIASVQDDVLVFAGRPFKVAEKFGLMPFLRLGYLAKKGLDNADPESLATMYDVIRQAIHEDDWAAFEQHATDVRADEDELMAVVNQAVQVMAARPTRRPSDSSDGPPATETNSSDGSSSVVSLTPRQQQRAEQLAAMSTIDDAVSFGTA